MNQPWIYMYSPSHYPLPPPSLWEGKGGMFWENSIETCILSRVKQITSPGWMYSEFFLRYFVYFLFIIGTFVLLICSFIGVVFLCIFIIIFFNLLSLKSLFPKIQNWIFFFLLVSALLSLVSGLCKLQIGWDLCWDFFGVVVCLFVFPLKGKAEGGGNPVSWWFCLYFCFVCCLDKALCTGCYLWLPDAGTCIQVVSFVWVLTVWYCVHRSVAMRSYPSPKVRGSDWDRQAATVQNQRPRGVSPSPRSEVRGGDGNYPTPEVRCSAREELPHIQVQEGQPWEDTPPPR